MLLYPINKSGKHGFINQSGKIVIPARFEYIYPFNDGLAWAAIEKDGKTIAGFINESGDWVIEPQFSGLFISTIELDSIYFSEGIAPVKNLDGKMFYIDTKGEPITDPIYDLARPVYDGRALVKKDKKVGYIDCKGKEVIPCQFGPPSLFSKNNDFHEGLAMVRFGEKPKGYDNPPNIGYIDKAGNHIFDPQFEAGTHFSEGLAMVKFEGSMMEYDFIDKEGEIPFERSSQSLTTFSDGLADMYDDESEAYGYVNKSGEWIIKPKFKETIRFTEGLAIVEDFDSDLKGFINKEGKLIIDHKFETAIPFNNGMALVIKDDRRGYINMNGDYVWRA